MTKSLSILAFTLFSAYGFADIYDVPKVETVALRKYEVRDEFTIQAGFFPKGAYSKYLAGGGSYTHSFSDFTSWEVANGLYAYELVAGLKKQLISDYFADPASFAVLKYTVTSNLVFTPIYTKNLLFNSSIVYSQFSFVTGAGFSGFNIASIPVIDVGLIMRFFVSQTKFLKFDFRYYKYLTSNTAITDNFTLIGGLSFNLGGDKRKTGLSEFDN